MPPEPPVPDMSPRRPAHPPIAECDPKVGRLVDDVVGGAADKWTMLLLETLAAHDRLRFSELQRRVEGVSRKMLTQTLRRMERDGVVVRTVHAEVPPRVDYRLTERGRSLGAAFCGVWSWAQQHLAGVEATREAFDARAR